VPQVRLQVVWIDGTAGGAMTKPVYSVPTMKEDRIAGRGNGRKRRLYVRRKRAAAAPVTGMAGFQSALGKRVY